MEIYESVSGARMHASYYRPGGISTNFTDGIALRIITFVSKSQKTFDDISTALSDNLVWKQRLMGVGCYSYKESNNYGLSGVMARCTGLKKDVRFNKRTAYGTYLFSNCKSFVTKNGDSLDRYLLRMQEMSESLSIITKNIMSSKVFFKNPSDFYLRNMWIKFSNKKGGFSQHVTMESTISHFKK